MTPNDPRNATWLRHLVDTPHWPPELDVDALGVALLENLKSPEAVLRDELSYTLLARAVESGRLSKDAVRALLRTALDDHHLFRGVGAQGDVTVFGRTFSVLVVPLVLEDPVARTALTPSDVHAAHDAVVRYAYTEQDRRGYVEGHGWAHSPAHTADALGALGLDPAVESPEPVLRALHHLATLAHPLAFLEDDRIAWAVTRLVQAGRIPDALFRQWLDRFQRAAEEVDVRVATLSGSNAEHVLRSLYFRLLELDRQHPWLEPVQQAARRFDLFYRPEG